MLKLVPVPASAVAVVVVLVLVLALSKVIILVRKLICYAAQVLAALVVLLATVAATRTEE